MSKKSPGNRQLNTGSDQDALTAEETAAMASMAADDGDGEDTSAGNSTEGADTEGASTEAGDSTLAGDGAEGADAGVGAGKKGKPLSPEAMAAVRIEREENKALKSSLKAAEDARKASDERFSTLEKRTNLILERLVPKAEEPKPEVIPDFNEDPAGWIAATMKQTGKTLDEIQKDLAAGKAEKAQQTEQQKQQEAVNDIISRAVTAERKFLATTPDYDDAGKFLQESRVAQLTAIGYSEEEIGAIIHQEKFAIAQKALTDNKNPAEAVYKVAQALGYKKKAAEGTDDAVTAAAKLEATRRGQETSQSLSNARGKGPSPMTAARLMEMSEAQFAEFSEKNPEQFKDIMGR